MVHTAVMYGEDDYNLGMEVGLPAFHTVGMDGAFVEGIHKELDGRYVKECDETIIELLSAPNGSNGKGPESGLLYREKATCTIILIVGEPIILYFTMPWILGLLE